MRHAIILIAMTFVFFLGVRSHNSDIVRNCKESGEYKESLLGDGVKCEEMKINK